MTDENHTHRWTHETARVRPGGTRIEAGAAFAPTAHEKRCWPGRMVALDDSGGAAMPAGIEAVDGIGPKLADDLRALGYETTDDLRTATADALTTVDGISDDVAADIQRQVNDSNSEE